MRVALLGHGTVLDAIEGECRARGWTIALRTPEPTDPATLRQADVGFAARYRHILTPDHLATCPVLNVHNGYLPWNKGAHPNVWPLIDGSPAGVTVHWMDEGVDTGPIVAQQRVEVLPTDTAETLYQRLEAEAVVLVREFFKFNDQHPMMALKGALQDPQAGSRHYARELAALDRVDMGHYEHEYGFEELLNRLRARTFTGYPGLRIGNVRATITLTPVEE